MLGSLYVTTFIAFNFLDILWIESMWQPLVFHLSFATFHVWRQVTISHCLGPLLVVIIVAEAARIEIVADFTLERTVALVVKTSLLLGCLYREAINIDLLEVYVGRVIN